MVSSYPREIVVSMADGPRDSEEDLEEEARLVAVSCMTARKRQCVCKR